MRLRVTHVADTYSGSGALQGGGGETFSLRGRETHTEKREKDGEKRRWSDDDRQRSNIWFTVGTSMLSELCFVLQIMSTKPPPTYSDLLGRILMVYLPISDENIWNTFIFWLLMRNIGCTLFTQLLVTQKVCATRNECPLKTIETLPLFYCIVGTSSH